MQEIISGKKDLPHGSSTNFEKYEDDDKAEHHSELTVRVEYIEKSESIFGLDVSTLKGRKTRQIPKVVVDDYIEMPRELIENIQELILFM